MVQRRPPRPYLDEAGGRFMGIEAEIFRSQLHPVPGEDIFLRDVPDTLIQGILVLPDGLDGKMGHPRIIVYGTIAIMAPQVHAASHPFRNAPGNLFDFLEHVFPAFRIRIPQHGADFHFIRHHVHCRPSMDGPHIQSGLGHGADIPAADGVQGHHDGSSDQHRIHTFFRFGGMDSFPMDRDELCVRIGGYISFPDAEHPGIPDSHMHPHTGVRLFFHQAGFDHFPATAAIFFCRLENSPHPSLPLALSPVQDIAYRQEIGGMDIMAAGMHDPVTLGSIGKMGVFLDGQGIHIRPEQQELPRLTAVNGSNHPGFHRAQDKGDPHPLEFILNFLAGPEFLIGQFRMGMEIMAHFQVMFFQFIGQLCNFFNKH